MTKIVQGVLAAVLIAFFFGGCATATCEILEEECNADMDECLDEYRDGDADCRKAMRDYAECVDESGCGSEDCFDEALDAAEDC